MTFPEEKLYLSFSDTEWPFEYTNHHRDIVRAIVYDRDGNFYFMRAERDDEFGKGRLIETSGGGVDPGENHFDAIRRELREELGAEVEIICKLGVISDYYNLIHRHNINNYFLCSLHSLGEKHLTDDEINCFHLSTLKLSFEEAIEEYDKCANFPLGRLIRQRELPILLRAKAVIDNLQDKYHRI